MSPRPPTSTLFPYTTLFRSRRRHRAGEADRAPAAARSWKYRAGRTCRPARSEEHTSELQSRFDLVCRLLLEKKKVIRPDGCVWRLILAGHLLARIVGLLEQV